MSSTGFGGCGEGATYGETLCADETRLLPIFRLAELDYGGKKVRNAICQMPFSHFHQVICPCRAVEYVRPFGLCLQLSSRLSLRFVWNISDLRFHHRHRRSRYLLLLLIVHKAAKSRTVTLDNNLTITSTRGSVTARPVPCFST